MKKMRTYRIDATVMLTTTKKLPDLSNACNKNYTHRTETTVILFTHEPGKTIWDYKLNDLFGDTVRGFRKAVVRLNKY